MRKIKLLLLLLSISICYCVANDSTQLKSQILIGYLDKEEVFREMPQVDIIDKEIDRLKRDYEEEFISMTKEYERKVKTYLEKNKEMSEPIKLAKQTEITELEQRMSMYKKRYNEEIEKTRKEKYRPIKEQIDIVIKEVCEENNITIVFDSIQPIYMSPQCINITTIVKEKFGI